MLSINEFKGELGRPTLTKGLALVLGFEPRTYDVKGRRALPAELYERFNKLVPPFEGGSSTLPRSR